jgi:hypothetical protein
MYVYLHDLYFLLNYYLKCVYIKESSDDIYNCFWKYCLNFKMKMYYLKGQCEFSVFISHVNSLPVLSEKLKLISKAKCLLKRIATPFDSVKINPSQVSKYPDNSLDNVLETCHN